MDEDVLATLPPADVIVPSLDSMTLSASEPPSFLVSRYITALIPHNLLHLRVKDASYILKENPTLVAARCAHLRSLEVSDTDRYYDADVPRPLPCAAFLESLRSSDKLADVYIAVSPRKYSASFLCRLAAYPSLRRMTLTVYKREDEPEELGIDHGRFIVSGFPALQFLDVDRAPWGTAITALASVGRGSQLTDILITADIPSYESYHAIVSAISSAGHPAHLTTACLSRNSEFMPGQPSYGVLDMKILALLSRFGRLETVAMTGLARSALTIDDCAEIASWWPALINLSLVTETNPTPSCTQAVLKPFRLCPQLTHLHIPLAETERDDVHSL